MRLRRKALLVAAKAGAIGPAVTLDGGTWEVESHPSVKLCWEGEGEELADRTRFNGKVRVSTLVADTHKGPSIHLDAIQVA